MELGENLPVEKSDATPQIGLSGEEEFLPFWGF